MLKAGGKFDTTINEAISIFTYEIDLINNWTNSAEVVNKNIDKYPEEYLKKYIAIRTMDLMILTKVLKIFWLNLLIFWPRHFGEREFMYPVLSIEFVIPVPLFHDLE